jgi:hypothetical protein
MQGNRRLISYIAATILVTGGLATGALAAVISSSSTALLRVDNRSNVGSQTTTLNGYTDLTGASVTVTIPTGGRLIRARFAAESKCEGSVNQTCLVRIVAFNTGTSATLELNPQSGTDFAFDAVSTDGAEAHAMERSRRLTPGTYNIKVQFAVTGIMVANTLDDWHFTVETWQ